MSSDTQPTKPIIPTYGTVGVKVGETDLRSKHLSSKFKSEPMVVIGGAAVIGVLSFGIYSFISGNSGKSQQMMRARILGQGATVGLMLGYAFYSVGKSGIFSKAKEEQH